MKVSIVIPCYKSSKSLEELTEKINILQQEMEEQIELLFVNDSPSNFPTFRTLEKLSKTYSFVTAIHLRKNHGQQIAILVGFLQAKGDLIMTMDDDLQHPTSEIPVLINAMKNDDKVDAIFAVPKYSDKKHGLWRNIGSFLLNKIDTFFLNKPKNLTKSAYKIMTKEIKEFIIQNYNAQPTISSLIITATSNIKNIEVKHNRRKYDKSNYNLFKLIGLSLDSTLHYSSLPLKLIGILGLVGLLFSFFYVIFILIGKYAYGFSIPGFATTVILITIFGGFNLFAVGIIGEYLIRIVKEQQKVPLKDLIKTK
ncbi:glycosyltransferase [Polaribacter litorisediminis]|uniref:glycosyltransferase n=1 Tax=Polaribacter litorisediminis TaxID=1908341 RepID=UPI001CBD62A3|nr:glycosyltransferase [Polaribacter litorisediminis]UAM96607.1 glycosyltransferase [Polaribacter litorisediminis]